MKDPYSILGVGEDASEDEIKSAYRTLAKKYHPDVNKDPDAESKFKEISSAYDAITSGTVNNYRRQDVEDTSEDIFEHFRKTQSHVRRAVNPNLDVEIEIEFLDACFGAEKNIHYFIMEMCQKCESHKSLHGEYESKKCDSCKGTGKITFKNGPILIQTTCSNCLASGKVIDCDECHGQLYTRRDTEIVIKMPAGINEGTILRATGRGNSRGVAGKYGDLNIYVRIRPHAKFQREDLNIFSILPIDYVDALLGNPIKADTIHGLVDIDIPECSNSNTVVCAKGKGIKKQGDHYFRLDVQFPKMIDKKERKILASLNRYKKTKKN